MSLGAYWVSHAGVMERDPSVEREPAMRRAWVGGVVQNVPHIHVLNRTSRDRRLAQRAAGAQSRSAAERRRGSCAVAGVPAGGDAGCPRRRQRDGRAWPGRRAVGERVVQDAHHAIVLRHAHPSHAGDARGREGALPTSRGQRSLSPSGAALLPGKAKRKPCPRSYGRRIAPSDPQTPEALNAELRDLAALKPTPERRARVEALLGNKWEGVQTVAAQVLATWGGSESAAALRAWLADLHERPYAWAARGVAAKALASCVTAADLSWAIDLYFEQPSPDQTLRDLPAPRRAAARRDGGAFERRRSAPRCGAA